MGLFDSFRCSVQPTVQRTTFFPGNVIQGALQVKVDKQIDFVAIRVYVVGALFQKWVTGSGKTRRTHRLTTIISKLSITVAGQPENGNRNSQPLPAGNYTYPFATMLPPNSLPSFAVGSGSRVNQLHYYVEGMIDIPYGFDKTNVAPFVVLLPIPHGMWHRETSITKPNSFAVSCCCCISKGSVSIRTSMSKTVVALDRDSVNIVVDIDNSKGEEPVDAVVVNLLCTATVKFGHQMSVTSRQFTNRIPCKVAPGQSQTVQGVLQLGGLAPASFASPIADCEYIAQVELDIPWATDPSEKIPVFVAHSVDTSNVMPTPEQRFGQFAPMMENAPPMMAPNFVSFNDVAGPPPPFAVVTGQPVPNMPGANFVPGAFFATQAPPQNLAECRDEDDCHAT